MAHEHTPSWQPISALPMIANAIDGMLESAEDVFQSLQQAQPRGRHVLDDYTGGRVRETHLRKPPQAVIIGSRQDQRTHALAAEAWRTYRPGRLVTTFDPDTVDLDALPPTVAAAAQVFKRDATPRAFVCIGQTCALPTSSPAEVAGLVRDYGRVESR